MSFGKDGQPGGEGAMRMCRFGNSCVFHCPTVHGPWMPSQGPYKRSRLHTELEN